MSKESVRSTAQGHLSPHSLNVQQHIPPVLITSSPNSGSRIIRQSSQPEASNVICCAHACNHGATNVSLRQLRDPSEGIAGIAADSLRINGAMRPFRQVCPFKSRCYSNPLMSLPANFVVDFYNFSFNLFLYLLVFFSWISV